MASTKLFVVSLLLALIFALTATISSADLSPDFYAYSCPKAIPAIKSIIEDAVKKERRMGASLLRLHFHDCFVKGCDGSILLDETETMKSEKSAPANQNSARGFEVIDAIKAEVDRVCGKSVVSCADILTVAARDSVVALGGPWWEVPLGRRDSLTAFREAAGTDIPSPFMDLPDLIKNFKSHGLNEKDLIALSGGHTLGFAQCAFVKPRLYGETNVNRDFAAELSYVCPKVGGDTNLAPFDPTPATFDKKYFEALIDDKGLLHSDQALFFRGGPFNELIKLYSQDIEKFSADFAYSMIKLGNLKPLTGHEGEIRKNCRKVNY